MSKYDMPNRHRPPTLTSLIVEAVALGFNTTTGLAELLGGKCEDIRSRLSQLEEQGRVARVGWMPEPGRQGPALRRWAVTQRRN